MSSSAVPTFAVGCSSSSKEAAAPAGCFLESFFLVTHATPAFLGMVQLFLEREKN